MKAIIPLDIAQPYDLLVEKAVSQSGTGTINAEFPTDANFVVTEIVSMSDKDTVTNQFNKTHSVQLTLLTPDNRDLASNYIPQRLFSSLNNVGENSGRWVAFPPRTVVKCNLRDDNGSGTNTITVVFRGYRVKNLAAFQAILNGQGQTTQALQQLAASSR